MVFDPFSIARAASHQSPSGNAPPFSGQRGPRMPVVSDDEKLLQASHILHGIMKLSGLPVEASAHNSEAAEAPCRATIEQDATIQPLRYTLVFTNTHDQIHSNHFTVAIQSITRALFKAGIISAPADKMDASNILLRGLNSGQPPKSIGSAVFEPAKTGVKITVHLNTASAETLLHGLTRAYHTMEANNRHAFAVPDVTRQMRR
ncbi:MAG: hypothetical protein K2Q12_05325 [Rickettsiales bacterium]|nr:hypothetical protein [Rickettsiales bacterium]